MTCTLTSAITVPNVTRWKVTDINFYDSTSSAQIAVQFLSPPAGGRTKRIVIEVSNTAADSIVKPVAPTRFDDDVEKGPTLTISGAYDRIEAAYAGGGTKAARYRAVESQLLTEGIVAATLTGTVA